MSSSQVPTRRLGNHNDSPEIPILGLGMMGLSAFYGTKRSDEDRLALLDRAFELGCTHWDSAAMYGDSEDLLGTWFEKTGNRNKVFLATKFGNKALPDGKRVICNDPEYIREEVENSLRRLKTDYIDLLYCHRISGDVTVEDIVTTMKELVDAGKVRYLGFSECGTKTLRAASKVHPIHAYQIEYSPFSMDIHQTSAEGGQSVYETCKELGIAVVAYSPIGRGMLTGQIRSIDDFEAGDFRRTVPRFSPENFHKNMELVDALKKIASRKGCTSGQLTLAWMMKQDSVFPIPGTTKITNLEENLGANAVLQTLTEADQGEITEVIQKAEVHGTRYAAQFMGLLMRDAPSKAEQK
ncbi:putative aldo-keto reductase [Cladorrhinum sp. PSN259]|nr:putative aldo-keto reductase [Cladorrhinum sp. PSN259]